MALLDALPRLRIAISASGKLLLHIIMAAGTET